jgi:Ca-activated chloride channel family protein
MNDKFIDNLLDAKVPEADKNARKIAINSAVSHFSQEVNQANIGSARPIDKEGKPSSINSIWSELMNFLKNPNSGRVFASVAVGFVAFALVSQMPDMQSNSSTESITAEPLGAETLGVETLGVETLIDSKPLNVEGNLAGQTEIVTEADSDAAATLSKIEPIKEDKIAESEFNSVAADEVAISLEEIAVTPMSTARKTAAPEMLKLKTNNARNQQSSALRMPTPEPLVGSSRQRPDLDEQYPSYQENRLRLVQQDPVSTFSVDVDTASYSLVRSQLLRGFLPAPNAVRTEEMINYFSYDYPYPDSKTAPFKASISVLNSPWNKSKKLLHIGIKGYNIKPAKTPNSNLVFLLDVSGSMSDANKLPLVKQSIVLLLNKLKPSDNVSIVVYAGAAGVVLEPTEARYKTKILGALQRLSAGGSTAGGAGIELAYQLAEQNFDADAVNRIILATDGDFNVGLKSNEALKTLVERKRDKGVFLSILGFGRNNYQDDMMQILAQNGNGVAAYIDSISEAKKVLVDQASSTLFTIAKDVKLQVEFNPKTVSDYRLIGYETRHLNREDFNNDKVDAGDIGAGHTVTAIYEFTPSDADSRSIDPLRYAKKPSKEIAEGGITGAIAGDANSKATEYGFLKIRYKLPKQNVSKLIQQPILISQTGRSITEQTDLNFSIAAASFAEYLKGGKYIGKLSLSDITEMAKKSKGIDPYGYRSEFIRLLELAEIAKP